jgi:hypothetical protein
VKYYYAGFRLGAFDYHLQGYTDMTPEKFVPLLDELGSNASVVYTAESQGRPMAYIHTVDAYERMEASFIWMPWATLRNRVECTVRFFYDMNEDFTAMVMYPEREKDFMFFIRRFGVVRYVGRIKDYYSLDKDGYMFQGNRIRGEA